MTLLSDTQTHQLQPDEKKTFKAWRTTPASENSKSTPVELLHNLYSRLQDIQAIGDFFLEKIIY